MPASLVPCRDLAGVFSALVTPFAADGRLDLAVVPALVEMQLKQGIAGFYVGGSTGEAFLQSVEERAAFLAAVAKAAAGRCRLIAHIGAVATQDCLALGRAAADAGYDAISAIPPFYYDFSGAELKAHYRTLCAAVPLPLIVYNFGGRVGRLTNADLLELLDEPRVIGVKHTSQDLYLLERFKRHRPEAVIYNGFDEMCLAGLAMGADGAIGTTYNFMGDLFVALTAAHAAGRIAEARAMQIKANRVIDVLIDVGVLPGTKGILALRGLDVGICREPFRALTEADRARLAECVALLAS